MKRNKLVSIAAITVALGVLATGCAGGSGSSKSDSKSSGGTKTVTVKAGTGANVKPYTYVGDDNETTGYDVEVLKEVFDRLDGYDLQIEVTDIPSVFSGVTSGTYQIGVNNFSYNEERAKSYLYSYPYDKIGYVFITKKGAPEVKTFADAAGKSFEGQSGVSVTTAIESWNEKNPDKKIDITYTDADTAITLQHIEDGTTDLAIIDVAMYNAYQKEYNYDVVANQISDEDAKAIADNSYAYYIFPKDQEELRDKVDEQLKELKKDPARLESVDQLARKFNMAIQYAHSEDYDLSILQLKSALSDNPHFVKGYLLLALLYIGTDNYEKARVTLRRVLKIDKANSLAVHYLREMGDTEENIIEMRKQNVDNDGLLDDDYLEEIVVTEDGRAPKKIEKKNLFQEIKAKKDTSVVRTGQFGQVSLAKYSGLYMLLGLVFGVLLFSFFILPGQKKKLRVENEQLIKTYSEELAGKNSTINSLSAEVDSLTKQIDTLQNGAAQGETDLPDYSNVVSGMSDTDLQNMIDKE